MFRYNAKILRVVDGDTIDVSIDLGFHVYHQQRLRLNGIDAPELNSTVEEERIRARESRDFLRSAVEKYGPDIEVTTIKDRREKFGRYLADFKFYGDIHREIDWVCGYMIDKGLAKKYGE